MVPDSNIKKTLEKAIEDIIEYDSSDESVEEIKESKTARKEIQKQKVRTSEVVKRSRSDDVDSMVSMKMDKVVKKSNPNSKICAASDCENEALHDNWSV